MSRPPNRTINLKLVLEPDIYQALAVLASQQKRDVTSYTLNLIMAQIEEHAPLITFPLFEKKGIKP